MKAIILAAALVLTFFAFAPTVQAGPPEPHCMPVYQETNVGPVKVVRRNTCSTEVYLCDRSAGQAIQASSPLDCMG